MNDNNYLSVKNEITTIYNELSTLLESFKTNLTDENMDKIMLKVLNTLGNAARADRCFIWKNYYLKDSQILCMKQIYEWTNEIYPVQDTELVENILYEPDLYDILSSGQPFNAIVKDLDDYNRGILEAQDIKSILCVPIHIEGEFWGFIGLDNCQTEELWSYYEVNMLISVSLTIGQIIKKSKFKS